MERFLSEHDCIAKVQEIERIQTKYFFAFNFLLQDANHLCNIIYRSLWTRDIYALSAGYRIPFCLLKSEVTDTIS
jgi:hypothetical protein